MKFEPEMREARLQVHHRQSFKAPGNNTAAMVGAWCYINIDPQLERGSFSQGCSLLLPGGPRLEEGPGGAVVTRVMTKQY